MTADDVPGPVLRAACLALVLGACGKQSPQSGAAALESPASGLAQPAPACPPDLSKPVPAVVCGPATDSPDGKISALDQSAFQKTAGANDVLISIQGGAVICGLPECPAPRPPCAAQTAVEDYWMQENLATQQCVRALIAQVGGTATPEAFWLTNWFEAHLTWPQIETVAANPDVLQIANAVGPPLP